MSEHPSEKTKGNASPGPDPDRLKIDGDWTDAVRESLKKKRPEGGWPDKKPDEGDPDHQTPAKG